jgi:hypothetical protein
MDRDYEKLPEHLREQVRLWIEEGTTPESFLRAVIRNDLSEAVYRGNEVERWNLYWIVMWFRWNAPAGSWGKDSCFSNWPLFVRAQRRQDA